MVRWTLDWQPTKKQTVGFGPRNLIKERCPSGEHLKIFPQVYSILQTKGMGNNG